jgi:hypothetical protein
MYDNTLDISLERFFFLMSHDSQDYKSASKETLLLYKEHYQELLSYMEDHLDKLQSATKKSQTKGLFTLNFVYAVRGKCSSHLDIINKLIKSN